MHNNFFLLTFRRYELQKGGNEAWSPREKALRNLMEKKEAEKNAEERKKRGEMVIRYFAEKAGLSEMATFGLCKEIFALWKEEVLRTKSAKLEVELKEETQKREEEKQKALKLQKERSEKMMRVFLDKFVVGVGEAFSAWKNGFGKWESEKRMEKKMRAHMDKNSLDRWKQTNKMEEELKARMEAKHAEELAALDEGCARRVDALVFYLLTKLKHCDE
jgi:hypothetical protein